MRALYRHPRILFLDEATSHLDASLETPVNEGIKGLKLTRITIARRLETNMAADRVYRMQIGQLIELGKEAIGEGRAIGNQYFFTPVPENSVQ